MDLQSIEPFPRGSFDSQTMHLAVELFLPSPAEPVVYRKNDYARSSDNGHNQWPQILQPRRRVGLEGLQVIDMRRLQRGDPFISWMMGPGKRRPPSS